MHFQSASPEGSVLKKIPRKHIPGFLRPSLRRQAAYYSSGSIRGMHIPRQELSPSRCTLRLRRANRFQLAFPSMTLSRRIL